MNGEPNRGRFVLTVHVYIFCATILTITGVDHLFDGNYWGGANLFAAVLLTLVVTVILRSGHV